MNLSVIIRQSQLKAILDCKDQNDINKQNALNQRLMHKSIIKIDDYMLLLGAILIRSTQLENRKGFPFDVYVKR